MEENEEVKYITLDYAVENLLGKSVDSDDAEEAKKYAEGAAKLMEIKNQEIFNSEKIVNEADAKNRELDIEERKVNVEQQKVEVAKKESKSKWWQFVLGLVGGAGLVVLEGAVNRENANSWARTQADAQDKGVILNTKGLLPGMFQTKRKK